MAMTDPVADLLTRVRNGAKEKHEKVEVPASRLKANIVRVLKDEGYIRNFRLSRDEQGRGFLKIFLKYDAKGESVIRGLQRVSRPGLRRYSSWKEITSPLGGAGISIISTSQGVMTGKTATTSRVGGEILCEVW